MFQQESFIDNVKIEKGARISVPTNLRDGVKFQFVAVCDDDAGKEWHAEAIMHGIVVLKTAGHKDHVAAVDEAERLLLARLAALIRDEPSAS